ncbi:MAG: Na+/H+ antiporter subunit E [Bryobacteraceae bacterium]|nr:Na+/H+ antiporter subunit E [Bryobacteraceae bacterium]
MTTLLWNLLLALLWALATGRFTPGNLLVGYLLGFTALWISRSAFGPQRYFWRVWKSICLLGFFFKELVLANLRVAYDVITPTFYMRPAIMAIPLEASSDAEITMLANMLTMTPGTLSLDVSPDRRTLYIHAMFAEDVEAVRREIKEGFERRLLEVLR